MAICLPLLSFLLLFYLTSTTAPPNVQHLIPLSDPLFALCCAPAIGYAYYTNADSRYSETHFSTERSINLKPIVSGFYFKSSFRKALRPPSSLLLFTLSSLTPLF